MKKIIENNKTNVSKVNALCCNTSKGLLVINYDEIICLKAERHYTHIIIVDQKMPIRVMKNISSIYLDLPRNAFFQCHRSYIINTGHIVLYRKKCKELVMKMDIFITVSKTYEKELLRILQ